MFISIFFNFFFFWWAIVVRGQGFRVFSPNYNPPLVVGRGFGVLPPITFFCRRRERADIYFLINNFFFYIILLMNFIVLLFFFRPTLTPLSINLFFTSIVLHFLKSSIYNNINIHFLNDCIFIFMEIGQSL